MSRHIPCMRGWVLMRCRTDQNHLRIELGPSGWSTAANKALVGPRQRALFVSYRAAAGAPPAYDAGLAGFADRKVRAHTRACVCMCTCASSPEQAWGHVGTGEEHAHLLLCEAMVAPAPMLWLAWPGRSASGGRLREAAGAQHAIAHVACLVYRCTSMRAVPQQTTHPGRAPTPCSPPCSW